MKKNNFNQSLADYAVVSGKFVTYIGERNPTDQERQIMERLLQIH